MKKLLSLFVALIATSVLWASNVLTYQALSLQPITEDAFNATIISHTYSENDSTGTIVFDGELTTIDDWAFYNCVDLFGITIPESVTTIGKNAFNNSDLSHVIWNATDFQPITNSSNSPFFNIRTQIYSFTFGSAIRTIPPFICYGMTNLFEVTMSDSVTSIGNYAFNACSNLYAIRISSTLTSIGNSAFSGCSRLYNIWIPNTVTSIGNNAFTRCTSIQWITIPESVTNMGVNAFSSCTELTSVIWNARNCECSHSITSLPFNTINDSITSFTIGPKVQTIPYGLCYGMSALKSVTIPSSVTSIGDYAFSGCSGLTSIRIPESVTSIGTSVFNACSGITSIEIPKSVTSLGNSVFQGCSGLRFVSMPESVTSIGNSMFSGCSQLYSFMIPTSVTSIGSYAFHGCSSLDSIRIPKSVTSIGTTAFSGCTDLTSVQIADLDAWYGIKFANATANPLYCAKHLFVKGYEVKDLIIPEGMSRIENYAFYNCEGLTSITFPSSVTSIGTDAFSGCIGVADIFSYASVPPAAVADGGTGGTFYHTSQHTYIHVPAGTIRQYQMAPAWSRFLHFYEISALPEGTPTDRVDVKVEGNYATFTWPVNPTASSYTLTITKNKTVFCTLTFNTLGQLVGMAFAPTRSGENPARAAQQTAYGYSFVVRGLDEGQAYDYSFTANDINDNVLTEEVGTFVGSKVTTGVAPQNSIAPSSKFLRDGQIMIQRGGNTYDLRGQVVR